MALDDQYEIYVGGWVDITDKVYRRNPVTITRGRADESSRVERSTATLTLKNGDGRFSSRNPTGPYYGLLGRNTPLRISVPEGETYLQLPGSADSRATAPDSAAVSITGDIDIRVEATLASWLTVTPLVGKYQTSGDQRSYGLRVLDGGALRLTWSTAGTTATVLAATSTAPVLDRGRQAVRATLDVDNGAGGWTATFYAADSVGGPWIQLGDPVTGAGATSIFNGTAILEVGNLGLDPLFSGAPAVLPAVARMHAMELRNGIGGTVVANPDFTAQTPGASSFADTATPANTWTITGKAELTDRNFRFHGEVSAWPQRWDRSGNDMYVPIQAAGILRRLSQGASPLYSTIRRGIITLTTGLPREYWPCEDASGAQVLASALPGHAPMSFTGEPGLAEFTGFQASAPLPLLNGAVLSGGVADHPATGAVQVRWLIAIPAAGMPNNAVIARVFLTGTLARVDLTYTTVSGGSLTLTGHDTDGTQLFASTPTSPFNGLLKRFSIELEQDGSDVDWSFQEMTVGDDSAGGPFGTLTGRTAGRAAKVIFNPGKTITDTAIGHISVHDQVTSIFELTNELDGYDGEPAGQRVGRLCGEEGIAFKSVDNRTDAEQMGPQRPQTLVELLNQCADADLGMLLEPREVFGLGYRTRTSLYNQAAPIRFRDKAVSYANAGTTVQVTIPGTTQVGDCVMIFAALSSVSAGDMTIAGGAGPWTPVGADSPVDDVNLRTRVWRRTAQASDISAAVTVSWDSSAKAGLICYVASGVDPDDPIDRSATAVEAGTDTTHDAPGVTARAAGAWLVELVADRGDASATITAPAGRVERAEQLGTAADTVDLIAADAGIPITPGGPTGAATYTFELAQPNAVGWSIALRPAPPLTLDYSAGHVAGDLEPVDDDESTRNDVTVTRTGGSSARAELESGPLSVQPPPHGVGRYDDEPPALNVAGDLQLPSQAWWRVHLGTVDEARYPVVEVDLTHARLPASLAAGLRHLDVGDRLVIVNLPPQQPPDDVNGIVQGYTETLTYRHKIEFNLSPASPYRVAVLDVNRYDTAGSKLATGIDADDTTLTVITTSGPDWTTDPNDLPFDIMVGGEQMKATAVAAAAAATLTEDFEDANLNITIADGGNAAWSRSSANAHAGTWSLKSGTITHNQTSDAIVAVPPDATQLQFWYRVSSEPGFDFFRFLIGPDQVLTASGAGAWTQSPVFYVGDVDTVTFRYTKDGSTSTGEDAAYIDDIIFTTPRQTFTAVRSANAVVKSHAAGAPVSLAAPAVWAL